MGAGAMGMTLIVLVALLVAAVPRASCEHGLYIYEDEYEDWLANQESQSTVGASSVDGEVGASALIPHKRKRPPRPPRPPPRPPWPPGMAPPPPKPRPPRPPPRPPPSLVKPPPRPPPSPRPPRPPPRPPRPPPRSPPPKPPSPPRPPPPPWPPSPPRLVLVGGVESGITRRPPPPVPNAGGGGMLGGSACLDSQAVLDTTNMYRSWHQAGPLQWSTTLAAAAQAYAQVLAPQRCPLIHAGVGGENLYTTTQYPKPDGNCLTATKAWYSEVRYYDWTVTNAFTYNWPRGVGHFTALIWKSATAIGCGVARADVPMAGMPGGYAGCKIVVCRYSLPVNVADNGYFLRNVLPIP